MIWLFWDFIFSCLLLQIALTLNWLNKNKGQESRLIITKKESERALDLLSVRKLSSWCMYQVFNVQSCFTIPASNQILDLIIHLTIDNQLYD